MNRPSRTCHVFVEDKVLVEDVVDEASAVLVYHEDLPLRYRVRTMQRGVERLIERTSVLVMLWIVLRMTVNKSVRVGDCTWIVFTIALRLYERHAHRSHCAVVGLRW